MQYKFFILLSFLGVYLPGYSQAFYENNAEGIPVYYTITSAEDKTVEVARPSVPYSGVFIIPENVMHNEIQYQVTGIGEDAFNYSSITEVQIPGSIRTIRKKAFYNCTTIESIALPGSLSRIEESTFEFCTKLKTITFSENIKAIDKRAFQGCSSITSIQLPGKILQIGERAFYNCSNLSVLEFSEGLTLIGKEAFGMTSLASVAIPSSVATIEEGAFSRCDKLKSFAVDGKNPHFCSENGILLSHSKELLHTWPAGNTDYSSFPEGVTQINGYAFYWLNLSSFTIPEGVTSIGELAFAGNKLTFISLPGTLRTLSSDAFNSSANINHVQCKAVVPPSTTGQFLPSFGPYTKDIVFEVPEQSIPAYEKAWGRGKFVATGATTQRVVLSEAGTLAGYLNEETLSTIFRLEITGPVNGSDVVTLQKMKNLLELDFANATIVSGGDPYETYQIETSTVEKVHTKNNCITEYMFSSIPSKLRKVILPSSIISIGNAAFYGCELESLEIPSGVSSIGRYAFRACLKLRSLQIPENLEFTGESAFKDCTSLQEVIFEGGTSILPPQLFAGCTRLSHVSLPEGLKTIGTEAFLNCTSLSSLTLPESVEEIGNWCFDKCTSLRKLEVRNPVPYAASSYTFYGAPVNACTLYVPTVSVSDYKEADYWKLFGTIIPLGDDPSSLESQENNEQTDALTVISIPGGFTLTSHISQKIYIRDLRGNTLGRMSLAEGDTHTFYNLPQGIYIINGEKVLVK